MKRVNEIICNLGSLRIDTDNTRSVITSLLIDGDKERAEAFLKDLKGQFHEYSDYIILLSDVKLRMETFDKATSYEGSPLAMFINNDDFVAINNALAFIREQKKLISELLNAIRVTFNLKA